MTIIFTSLQTTILVWMHFLIRADVPKPLQKWFPALYFFSSLNYIWRDSESFYNRVKEYLNFVSDKGDWKSWPPTQGEVKIKAMKTTYCPLEWWARYPGWSCWVAAGWRCSDLRVRWAWWRSGTCQRQTTVSRRSTGGRCGKWTGMCSSQAGQSLHQDLWTTGHLQLEQY